MTITHCHTTTTVYWGSVCH